MSDVLNDSCVAEVRAKYAEDLEELLLCPICLARPSAHVRLCKLGHHLCEACWTSLRECPTCKTRFSPGDGRNFLAEELSSRWDEFSYVFAPPAIMPRERTIDCRIDLCQTRLPTEKMPDHVRNVHASSLVKKGKSEARLDVAYGVNRIYSYALEAEELGLFFFVVFIDRNGDAQMELQVAHSCSGVESFEYFIGVQCPNQFVTVLDENQCASGDEKGSHVCKFGKNRFTYYYKDGGILDEEKKDPFTVRVQIEKSL